ncbi:hypothetical protein D3C80_1746790 [compost metagenome]
MFKYTRVELIHKGECINNHSEENDTWVNPIDFIPPISSIFEYKTADNEILKFIVSGYKYSTEEVNDKWKYKNMILQIFLEAC